MVYLSFPIRRHFTATSHEKSFFRSSCFPLSSCRDDKSWVPHGSSSGPFVLALCGNSQGLAPFQFLRCLDPIFDVVCQHFLICFSCAFSCITSNLLPPLPGMMCFLYHSRMKYYCPTHIHHLYCFFSRFMLASLISSS